MQQVKFSRMIDGDAEDYRFMLARDAEFADCAGERLFEFLANLENSFSCFQVSRLEHCLQTATRAWHDGADTDWVVSALLHDIGDIHAPYNHGDYAASILSPFVREQCVWVTRFHEDFQLYYFPDNVGVNPNTRDKYLGQLYFDDCASFCHRWDQESFDPAYQSLPLETFRPLVLEVFSRKPFDPEVVRVNTREPLVCRELAQQRAPESA